MTQSLLSQSSIIFKYNQLPKFSLLRMNWKMSASTEDKPPHPLYENQILQKHQIRLLSIAPKKTVNDNEDIWCKLETVNLHDQPFPRYTALSYHWGDQNGKLDIKVNDQVFEATKNLYEALKHFRTQNPIPKLWVDAICINQEHDPEKEGQVRRMQRIFAEAERTWVWLGPEKDESGSAIELVEVLGNVYDSSCKEGDTGPKFADTWASLKGQGLEDDLLALDCLLAREYWYRVWIVQEIALSRNLTLFCGRRKFLWDSLLFAALLLNVQVEAREIIRNKRSGNEYFRGLLGGIQRILSVQSVRNDVHDSPKKYLPDSLLSLLSNHRFTGATNERDKYIALAGIAEFFRKTEFHGPEEKDIWYGNEVGDVYITACEVLTKEKRHRALDFLDCAGLPRNMELSMPSWVPDWSVTQGRAVPLLYWDLATKKAEDIELFNAPGGINRPEVVAFLIDRQKERTRASLVARGRKVDLIKEVNTIREAPPAKTEDQATVGYTQSEHPEQNRRNLADALWRTLILNRAHADGRKAPENWGGIFYEYVTCQPSTSSPFFHHQQWYDKSKHFRICGFTLEELAQEWRGTMSAGVYDQVELAQFKTAFTNALGHRNLACTDEMEYLCLVPFDAKAGDIMVVLFDCNVPVLLRRLKNEELGYEFIGTCYVHGIMDGGPVNGQVAVDCFPDSFTIW